jgi:mannose-6-phosphate isomerase-like protein (cupin superfamily)
MTDDARRAAAEPAQSVIILGDREGRSYPCGTMRAVFKADGPETNDTYSISEWWLDPRSGGPGAHHHDVNDDVFYVLSGAVTFVLDGAEFVSGAGSFVRVPPGVVHDYRNDGDEPARLLNVYVPGGFEAEMPAIVEWFAKRSGGSGG